jgi:hypothetical protein
METITTTTTTRIDFDLMSDVEDALFAAFNDDRDLEVDDVNPEFIHIFNVVLSMAGWSEEDYFAEMDVRIQAAREAKEEQSEVKVETKTDITSN